MIHLRNAAKSLIEELRKDGFNGVDFYECKVQSNDLEALADGFSQEDAEKWDRDYVCLLIAPDWEDCISYNPYQEMNINTFEFETDLKKKLEEVFGKECKICFDGGCDEIEVYRRQGPGYEEFITSND